MGPACSARGPIATALGFRQRTRVVKGPEPDDCWIWTGATGDHGYRRLWTRTVDGEQQVLRPQRYAFEKIAGRAFERDVMSPGASCRCACTRTRRYSICARVMGAQIRSTAPSMAATEAPRRRSQPTGAGRLERAARARALRALVLELAEGPRRHRRGPSCALLSPVACRKHRTGCGCSISRIHRGGRNRQSRLDPPQRDLSGAEREHETHGRPSGC